MQKFDQTKLKEICSRHKVKELSLFGSATGKGFRPDSDIDLIVEFEPDADPSLFDMVELRDDLKEFFGREIDLVSLYALMTHHNAILRDSILEKTETLYAA